MAYKLHNFLTGDKLKAASLNEMDAQIRANAEGVALFTMDTIVAAIKQMRLTTDGEYLYLYYGDTLLDEAAVSDASDIIQCEGMTVTSPTGTSIVLQAGSGSVKIQTAITPSDCSQSVRFRSSDISVAAVNSSGVLAGKSKGNATMTVTCGKYRKTFVVSVWEQMNPDWVTGNWMDSPYTNVGKTGVSIDVASSAKRAMCYPYTDQKGIYLRQGEKLTVTCSGAYRVQYYVIIQPGDGELTYTTVPHNGNHFVVIDPDTGGAASKTNVEAASFTYTAEKNCYIGMSILREADSSAFTADEISKMNQNITCRVDPAQA